MLGRLSPQDGEPPTGEPDAGNPLLDLPLTHQYRVIFMRRNLDEVIASQNKMLERQGKSLGNLPAERLKQVFLAQINKVVTYLEHHDNFRIIEVSYNDTLEDAASAISQVNGFLGGGLDTAAMTQVTDPALYRNRR